MKNERLESVDYFCYGAAAVVGGFLVPVLALPCFGGAFACFAVSQMKANHEHKFIHPKRHSE